ncbi:hypothetical protein ABBQ32_006761 [Trebouxia sp. C0010 RCD-2024]
MERFKFEDSTPSPVPLHISGRKRAYLLQGYADDSTTDSLTDKDDNYMPHPHQNRRLLTMQTRSDRRLHTKTDRTLAQRTTSASSHQTSGAASADRDSAQQGTRATGQPVFTTVVQEELADGISEDNQEMDHHGGEASSDSSLPTAQLSDFESTSSEEVTARSGLAPLVPAAGPQPAARLPAPLHPSAHPTSGTSGHVTPAPAAAAQIQWAASTPTTLAAATAPETQPATAALHSPPMLPLPSAMSHPASARHPPAAAGSVQAQPGASGASSTEAAEPAAQPPAAPLAVQGTDTPVPVTGAFVPEPLADTQMLLADEPEEPASTPVTFRKAVEVVNEKLQGWSDMRLISPEQLKGLDDTLEITVLLELPKGDIRDLLMNPCSGGLSLKQALFMQAYILRQSVHVAGAVLSLDASLSAGTSSSSTSLSTVVAGVNNGLNNLITPGQVKRLEGSLSGIEDLLNLAKGDIRDVLTEELFGGLSLMQGTSMQMSILRIKAAKLMC